MKLTNDNKVDKELPPLLPLSTRIRHKEHSRLIGVIISVETASADLPYMIDWDDVMLARELLGSLYWWTSVSQVELEEDDEQN